MWLQNKDGYKQNETLAPISDKNVNISINWLNVRMEFEEKCT